MKPREYRGATSKPGGAKKKDPRVTGEGLATSKKKNPKRKLGFVKRTGNLFCYHIEKFS
jgi:hypothetical protein